MTQKPKGGWKSRRDSAHKMIIWFNDGEKRTFYSLDWKHSQSARKDDELGLARLRNLVARYGHHVGTAIIYHIASDLMVAKFVRGIEVDFKKAA